jgi:DNA invertase Pin-like site-specific DNA recombinase
MSANKPVAYSYERVSTGSQVEGRGLSRQADMAANWCKHHGYRLDTKLDLSDAGTSAFKGKNVTHGALGEFLKLAEAGELGPSPVLLIEAVDRLSRQEPMRALQRIVFTLVEAGAQIVDLEDGRIYDRESLAGDALIMLVLRCKAAHEYSQRLSRRIRDSWANTKQAMRDGTESGRGPNGGKHPYWLAFNPTTRQWELNDHAAEDVRLIFDELQHHGLTLVAQTLNLKGSRSPGGKPWAHYSVRKIASDPASYGALRLGIFDHDQARAAHHRWRKAKAEAEAAGQRFREPEPEIPPIELIPNHYPPVVDQQTFDRVAAALAHRGASKGSGGNRTATKAATHTFLQAGVAQCQHGGTLGAHLSRKPGRDDIYYLRCRARLGGKGCRCTGTGWRLEDVHAHVATRLSAHLLGQAVLPGHDHRHEQEALKERLEAARQLLADATTQVNKAAASMEQAVDADAQLDLLENLSHLLEKRRTTQRSAQAQVDELQQDLRNLQARTNPAAELTGDPVRLLLQALASGTDTQAERQRLHQVLVRAGLQVVFDDSDRDNRRVGMRFGIDAALQWKPLAPAARKAALQAGAVDPAVAVDRIDARGMIHGVVVQVRAGSTEDLEAFIEEAERPALGTPAAMPPAVVSQCERRQDQN